MNRELITLRHVSAGYGRKQVFSDIDLTVYEHDFLGIIGPNGGGKTTLLKLILGLLRPTSGTITYYRDGEVITSPRIGYLPQYQQLDRKFPISVEEVVRSGLGIEKSLFHRFTKEQESRLTTTIERLELSDLRRTQLSELSGGQLQRVLLARAVVSRPDVIMLDEPNTYIDYHFQHQMYQMLSQFNEESAIVMVSHDIGSVLQNVKSIACVNHDIHYHPSSEVDTHWLRKYYGCPIDLIDHGAMPHRILKEH
jgi:zinc transport system ATP-binding protein